MSAGATLEEVESKVEGRVKLELLGVAEEGTRIEPWAKAEKSMISGELAKRLRSKTS